METWIVADANTLKNYGHGFTPNALPRRANLEEEPKDDVYTKLQKAASNSQKGEYNKIRHVSDLLQKLNTAAVERRCRHFEVFTHWLVGIVDMA